MTKYTKILQNFIGFNEKMVFKVVSSIEVYIYNIICMAYVICISSFTLKIKVTHTFVEKQNTLF